MRNPATREDKKWKQFLRPRRLLFLAAVLLVAFLVVRGCGGSDPSARPFETATVRRGDLVATVSATGTLSAVGTVEVGTQVSGTVERVLADFNDRVEAGDLLAVLNTESLDAAVRDAQAGVDRARAALLQAKAEVDRAHAQAAQAQAQRSEALATLSRNKTLFDKGYLSEQELIPLQTSVATAEAAPLSSRAQITSAEAAVVSARAAVASAEASRAQIRKNRRNAEIRAPISGLIIQRSIDAGQTVAASFSTPTLFVIAEDLAEMEILVQVDESDIGLVEPGQPVAFTVAAYPDRTFEGLVQQERLQPQTVQNVVLYTVVVAADNDSGLLLPGMTATVSFVVGGVEDALLVPTSALRFDPPEAVRAAARQAQRAADAATASDSTQGAAFASDVAEVWIPTGDAKGPLLRPLLVRILAADGADTAITPLASSGDLVRPGLEVVTRMDDQDAF